MNKITDTYFKKIVSLKHEGINFDFKVSQDLFSSHDVDNGTRRLLRSLKTSDLKMYKKVLDLGCGYGPLGIVLKSLNKDMVVHMVDRDALALAFSKLNSEINKVKDIQVYGSLGYDRVKDCDFDLIVSNIPAKVGTKVLSRMLLGGINHLTTDGQMIIVIIDAIYKEVSKILSDKNVNILFHKKWPGHHVFKYEFNGDGLQKRFEESGWTDGSYDRKIVKVSLFESLKFSIKTTYNLSEFDTLSYATQLLLSNLDLLKNIETKKALFFNLNHGYLPVAVSKLKSIQDITLSDRNLQALEITKTNLIENGYDITNISSLHQVGIGQKNETFDIVIGTISEKESLEVLNILVDQFASLLNSTGVVLIASSVRTINNVSKLIRKNKKLKIWKKAKSKGKSKRKMFIAIKNN